MIHILVGYHIHYRKHEGLLLLIQKQHPQNQTVYRPTSNIFALTWRRASNEESKIPVSCYQISFGQPEALPVALEKIRR